MTIETFWTRHCRDDSWESWEIVRKVEWVGDSWESWEIEKWEWMEGWRETNLMINWVSFVWLTNVWNVYFLNEPNWITEWSESSFWSQSNCEEGVGRKLTHMFGSVENQLRKSFESFFLVLGEHFMPSNHHCVHVRDCTSWMSSPCPDNTFRTYVMQSAADWEEIYGNEFEKEMKRFVVSFEPMRLDQSERLDQMYQRRLYLELGWNLLPKIQWSLSSFWGQHVPSKWRLERFRTWT